MQIRIQATVEVPKFEGLNCCEPVLMRNPEGRTVVIIRGYSEALCFDTDGSVCYSDYEYYNSENGYTFIRALGPKDILTVKGTS